jgi:flagellar motor switch protein FliN/FliY
VNQNEKLARYAALTFPLEPELGRCVMSVREIVELAPGSVIKLGRVVGSKIDIQVGGVLFGTAELVSLGETLAVRFSSFAGN